MSEIDELLTKLYYSNKTGYTGSKPLWRKAKEFNVNIKQRDVTQWLQDQSTCQVHKEIKEPSSYLPIFSNTPKSLL